MPSNDSKIAAIFLKEVGRSFEKYLSRIVHCLDELSEENIWWRPNEASNSAGNLVLHLSGNVRQWIVSGLGGAPDARKRDLEFSERGPVPRRELIARSRKTINEARRVLGQLTPEKLLRNYTIQGFHVTGLEAVAHVYEHFSNHVGQIIYITKMKQGKDLGLTKLPPLKKKS